MCTIHVKYMYIGNSGGCFQILSSWHFIRSLLLQCHRSSNNFRSVNRFNLKEKKDWMKARWAPLKLYRMNKAGLHSRKSKFALLKIWKFSKVLFKNRITGLSYEKDISDSISVRTFENSEHSEYRGKRREQEKERETRE